MNSKPSTMKTLVLVAAMVAGISGLARADDNSMDPHNGDSYAYFNGGNLPQGGKPVFDKTPSEFHVTNPHGLPFSTYEALSTVGPEYKPAPIIDKTPSTFHVSNPHGLPFSTYVALSSSEWPSPVQLAPRALASTDDAAVTKSAATTPLGTGTTQFFHIANADHAASAN